MRVMNNPMIKPHISLWNDVIKKIFEDDRFIVDYELMDWLQI